MQAPLPPQSNANVSQTSQVQSTNDSIFQRRDISDGIKSAALTYRLNKIIEENESQGVTTSVSLTDLQNNRTLLRHNENAVQFAASVNKIPIAWLVLQDLRSGKIHMDDTVTWMDSDIRAGYGTYDQPGAPKTATVKDVINDMLNRSGNTAVRILVNYELGGAAAVNARLSQYSELPNTRLQPLDSNRFYVGNSTSKESLWTMKQLLAKSDSYQKFMKHSLETNIFSYYGVRSQLEGNDYIVLANKVGILDDVDGNNRHDVGIIYNTKTHKAYGYSFMTTTAYENVTGTAQAEHSLDLMGKDVLRFAGDKPGATAKVQPFSAHIAPQTEAKIKY